MTCRKICWFICTFVAVATAIGYRGQDSNTGSHSEVTVRRLRVHNAESSTADALYKPSTAVDLGALLDAGEGAVVVLVAGDTRLVAHRAVLSARSPVFQRILQDSGTSEVAIADVEGPVLRQLVSYLYTLQAPQLPAMAPQLLAAADQYGLPALKADCEQQVARQLSVETAAATAVLAVRHSCDSLRKAAVTYIGGHISQVTATEGWADAISTQPEVMAKVLQLLSQSSTETRSLSLEEKNRRLIEAAKEGSVGELEAMLAAGADVGARDRDYMRTGLHWAADQGHEEAARRLLAAGAAVDARDVDQWTPLHWAARHGHAAVVRLLLAAGADHGARSETGGTPLHYAAHMGHRKAAAALLEAGADTRARDQWGDTPLDDARRSHHWQVARLLQRQRHVTAVTSKNCYSRRRSP